MIQYHTVTNDHKKGSLSNGLKKFKGKGKQAARVEIQQLHNRKMFVPIHPKDITQLERTEEMNSLISQTEKKDGTIKT